MLKCECIIIMSELDNFFEMLAGTCPVNVTPANMDSIAPEEPAPAPTSTSNDVLLEKISALENMIAEMKNNTNNGVHIES